MEVKPGYKQTEVGVIPEDWLVKPISQISTPVRGGSPRPAGDTRYFNGSYIPWLTVAGLTNIPASQLVVSETTTCLTEEGSLHSRTLSIGTPIIANSGATLGVAKILGIKCCANDGIAALLNLSRMVSPHYLTHFINTKTTYLRDIVATGNGQPNLNTTLIGDFKIPLPPTKAEQEAIAEALSDADALIESQEQLLTKKRHLKQGAMQELLTGKTRLPGFSGEWEVKRLGDVARFFSGGTPPTAIASYYGGDIPWITSGDLNKSFVRDVEGSITKEGLESSSAKMVEADTLLIALYGATSGVTAISKIRAAINQTVLAIIPQSDSGFFLFYKLSHLKDWIINTYTQGGQPNLSGDIVKSIKLALPTLEEQIAIAAILSDMDAEIAAMETKLTKTRQLKQGMMQDLLTGRIRLI